jgi:endo-1,4-beta-D-glucanase Y
MKASLLLFLILISTSLTSFSQNYPFPRNEVYTFGIMPLNGNHVDADSVYQNWKANHVTSQGAGGFRRVLWDTLNATVSEGIGYGMLIAVNVNDKDLFDDLWGYYNLHLDPNGLMRWLRDSLGNNVVINGTTINAGSATDAEEDVAYALILADRQWGSGGSINYIQKAIEQIDKIYQFEIDTNFYLPKSGDEPGGIYRVNISYFAPAYYRAFREVTGNTGWDSVITACYNFLFFRADPNTGLVPDWCLPNGDPLPPCPPPYSCRFTYYYDATRTPWRIAMDYIWHGNINAFLYCNEVTSFARSIGSQNIVDEYSITGDSLGMFHNNAFIGPFAAGAMATSVLNQLFLDSIYAENVNTYSSRWNYYNSSLKTLTLLVLTGNFINGQVALPVELVSFTASVDRREVYLRWTTSGELNNSGFEIERSSATGGVKGETSNEWKKIGFINGNGTSNETKNYSFTDRGLNTRRYNYRLKQVDYNGNFEYFNLAGEVVIGVPDKFDLSQNYPNPFNPVTKINFDLPFDSRVTMKIFDITGREMATLINDVHEAGYYTVTFDAGDIASGIYFYRIIAEGGKQDFVMTKKMLLLR